MLHSQMYKILFLQTDVGRHFRATEIRIKIDCKMNIERKELIELCDKFLNREITKSELEFYAFDAIMSDEFDWDDDDNVIYETIFDWDNEIINYPINEVNMKLWKKRLETNVDELLEHNNWNVHIEKQKEICEKYKSKWKPISRNLKVGVSDNLNLEKLNGLRHKTEKGKVCWYIFQTDLCRTFFTTKSENYKIFRIR
jgi:hypothetical protein